MTPDTNDHGVASSNTIASGEVFLPLTHSENEPKNSFFTQYSFISLVSVDFKNYKFWTKFVY